MSNLFFRDPRLLVLTLFTIVVAGLAALEVLPRAEDPEIRGRNATVVTALPGAGAERVEALVTEKIEAELHEVEEIGLLTSSSSAGISIVQVELRDDVTETDEVWSRVRDRIAGAAGELPAGAALPRFDEFEISAFTLIAGLAWTGEGPAPAGVLRRLAEGLEDELRAVPGTKDTELYGAVDEEVLVEVDAARLAALGISAADVARAVEASDAKASAGQLRGATSDVLIEVEGELDSLDRLRDVPVTRGEGGRVVRLGEVARIAKGAEDPPREVSSIDGRPGVAVAARMEDGRRVDRWSERARAVLAGFAARAPRGVELSVIFDQSRYTVDRLAGLASNLALGAFLVTVVTFVAMGWRSALIVGASLPLSSLMVLTGMNFLGIPLQQMSVTGLIIALGLLIDNAIVIVDEVKHRRGAGEGAAQAIASAVRALAVPLGGSTVTTVLAFLPLVLMPGPAGEFVGSMSISVILALASSLFLSLTVIPALVGWTERLAPGGARTTGGFARTGVSSERLTELYRRTLGVLFARPSWAIGLALVAPLAGFAAGTTLEEQFFPPADRDQFQIELELPTHASLRETLAQVERARELVRARPEVEAVHFFAGRSAPKFYYNMIEGREGAAHYAQGLVQLDSAEGSVELMRALQHELDAALPGARVLIRQLEQGPPFEAPVELHLAGPDLDVLRELGERARAELAAVPGVVHTRSLLTSGTPTLLLRTDSDELERAGLRNTDVARDLEWVLEGAVGGSILESTEELPVRVRLSNESRADLGQIASLELVSGDAGAAGTWTPLESLGELELRPEPGSIPHRHGERSTTVQGFLEAGLLPSKALEPFRERLASAGLELPPGYRMDFGGEAAERDEAVGNLASSAAVLMVLMATTLVLSFHSFRLAAVVGAVAFLSVGLALGSLAVFGYPFGFMAIVGSMGLMGIAINDTIVVLAAIRADERASAGDPQAVRDVVVRSTRHVLSTTVTTVAGFLPLILAGGAFWPPLAVAIAGGVGGATLMALTLAPGAYVLLRRRRWRAQRREASPAPQASDPKAGVLCAATAS